LEDTASTMSENGPLGAPAVDHADMD